MRHTADHVQGRDTSPTGMPEPMSLSVEVVEFIESGVSIIVGVVGPDGRAQAGRAMASRVVAPGTIRIIFSAEGNDAMKHAANLGSPIAVTFSAPLSYRTIQIKGMTSRIEQIEPEDLWIAEHQTDVFAGVLTAIGHPPEFAKAICDYRSATLHVLSFPAHAAFEQTPGPGAGRAI